jgi:hypothetical protein
MATGGRRNGGPGQARLYAACVTRIGPGYDWGQRTPRWAGITSRVVDIGGTRVHYLRAGVEESGPTHLLIHPMGSGAWSWMDVIGPLSTKGLVIAPDLPGSGRSRPIRRGGGDILPDVLFMEQFAAVLAQAARTWRDRCASRFLLDPCHP